MMTDVAGTEALVFEVVRAGNAALPERVVAWYVIGSHADGTAAPGSDLDLVAVLDGSVRDGEDQVIRRSRHGLGEPYRTFVDVHTVGLDRLVAEGDVAIAARSRLAWGRDIRAQLATPDLDSIRRRSRHVPRMLSARLRGDDVLACPLGPPDPTMVFFGYEVCRFLPSATTVRR
jgi:predicted nucleotidyltransferase